ncbi:MAG: UvrD-helicase domain-containing protein [Verrucomicrobia bacterium]|nr:UvrD-helicase domain-containing protein [Verrucomicrobiota bacterium]
MSTRADFAARKRFAEKHDQNFAVVAAAGAGKTRSVVERIVALAQRDKEAVGRLVVVTYTKSAAREFKRRVTAKVLEKSKASQAPGLLAALDRAFFGTIHSFCLGLLSDHQVELGFPSRLQTITAAEGRRLWEDFLNEPDTDEFIRSHPLTARLLRFCSFADLLNVANRMENALPRKDPPANPPVVLDASPLEGVDPGRKREKGEAVRRRLVQEFDRYNRALASAESFIGLPNLEPVPENCKAACGAVLRPLLTWLEDAACDWASALATRYCRQRHRDGLLTFSDQIGLTVNLLQRPHVLQQLRRRQFCVILDEAQDTDPRMFQVLVEITRPLSAPWGTWPGDGEAPRPGAFVMVGDPRQTIYDQAGPATYRAIGESFRKGHGGESLEFSVTHRCSVRVVETINRLFTGLQDQDGAAPFDNLQASETAIAGAAVLLPLRRPDPAHSHVEAECRDEARQIAAWLARVGERGVGVHRWGQVAILAPRHAWLETCSVALREAGINHRLFRPRTRWRDQPGFTWPLSVLYTVLHPWDRFERIGVLREIFAVSDRTLARWTAGSAVSDPLLHSALETLMQLRAQLLRSQPPSIVEFVQEICRHLRLRDRLSLLGDPGLALDSFLARAYEATQQGASLSAWLQSLLDLLDEEASVQDQHPYAIDLVTIHSAKGLEWEVVIPLGLSRAVTFNSSSSFYPQVVETREWSGVVWSGLSARQKYTRKMDGDQERRRLLYVCLTRAKRALVIPYGEGFYTKPAHSLANVAACRPDFLPVAERLEVDAPLEQEELSLDVLSPDPSTVQAAAAISQLHPRLSRPHALAEDAERTERFLEDVEGAFDFGRWWHSWIEHFPWKGSSADHSAYCQNIPADLAFGARARQEAQRFFESEALRLLLAAGMHFRCESPFSFCHEPALWVEGVIDLLVQTHAGETWILDWKTNQPAPGQDLDAFLVYLQQKYLPQLAAYRHALEQGFGVRVDRLLIYSTVLGRFA